MTFSRRLSRPPSARGGLVTLGLVLALAPPALAQPGMPQPVRPSAEVPGPLGEIGIEQRLGESVPLDLAFRDEHGREVTLRRYFDGKPVVLSLAYYDCPMLCPVVINGIVTMLRALPFEPGREFTMLNVSFNPAETPVQALEKKQQAMDEYGREAAADGWHFLTGEPEAIRALTEAVGFRYSYDARTGQFAHATGIMVLTPEGRLSRYFYGVEYSPRDVRLGLVEASEQRISSPVDQLLLACFHYDPTTGKYSLMTFRLVRAGAVAVLLALGTFMFVSIRRERRGGAASGTRS